MDTSEAVEGPVFLIPVKNDQKASTVEIIVIIATAMNPSNCVGGEKPMNKFMVPYMTAAPSVMNAEDWMPMPSLTDLELINIYEE